MRRPGHSLKRIGSTDHAPPPDAKGIEMPIRTSQRVLLLRSSDSGPAPYSDDFSSADPGWLGAGFGVSGGKGVITPTQGSELFVNGDFSAWTADDPDGWTVTEHAGSLINEVGTGEGAGGAGTGSCNFNRVDAPAIQITQDVATAGSWYLLSAVVSFAGGVAVRSQFGTVLTTRNYDSVATLSQTERQVGTATVWLRALGNGTDVTLDSTSLKALTDIFVYRVYATSTASLQVNVTRTAYTQAGIMHYSDANNLVMAYLDGYESVKLVKRVGGTYTEIASAAITYSAGAALKLVRPVNGQYVISYGGVEKIDNNTINDAVFNSAQNWGLFSTAATNTFDDLTLEAV